MTTRTRPAIKGRGSTGYLPGRKITMLPVVDAERRVVGALNIHDLLRARVV